MLGGGYLLAKMLTANTNQSIEQPSVKTPEENIVTPSVDNMATNKLLKSVAELITEITNESNQSDKNKIYY